MTAVWSSDAVPERERFSAWREACCQRVYAITPERENRNGFRGRITGHRFGGIDLVELECEGHRVQRRREDIAQATSDTYYVYQQLANHAWFNQSGRELMAEPGDVVVADPNIPFSTGATADFDFRLWRVPRAMLDPLLPVPGRLTMTHLRRRDAMGNLLSGFLGNLGNQIGTLDRQAEEGIIDNVVRLVAVGLGASVRRARGRQALRAVKLDRALRYIDRHLSDPGLSPPRAASALGMSVRALHMLFEERGVSFGQAVKSRRLEQIRSLLLDPATERSVTDIALAWGFSDLSTFYRAFGALYGKTPGQMRRRA
jgi:AraC-like DNA-binding protein